MKRESIYFLYRVGLPLGLGLALVLTLLFIIAGPQPAAARPIAVPPPAGHPAINLPAAARPPITQPPAAPLAASVQSCYFISQITETSDPVFNRHPSISDNGDRIAFVSDKDGNTYDNYDIFLYDGTPNPTNVTNSGSGVTNEQPSISGNGNYIAFVSDGNLTGGNADRNREIFSYPGISQVTVSPGTVILFGNLSPSINYTGTRIAFVSDHDLDSGNNADGNQEIFLDDGGSINQVTDSTLAANFRPSINKDGSRIAFVSNADLAPGSNPDGNQEIFLYDNSTGISQVTTTGSGVINEQPSISGDGSRIAFVSNADLAPGNNPDGNQEIFLYSTTGISQVTTTGSGFTNEQPSISDDGTRIAFVSNDDLTGGGSNPDGNPEIFVAFDFYNVTFDQVTSTTIPITNSHPSINKSDTHVAFVSNGDLITGDNSDGNQEIFLAECNIIDLTLTKSAPSIVQYRKSLKYTINITNNGPSQATDVELVDKLPSSVKFKSVSSDDCSHSGGTVTCSFDSLAGNGDNENVTIVVTPTKQGLITNTATVTATQFDSEKSNNKKSIITDIRYKTSLEVKKYVTPTQAIKGQPLTYTIIITNTGGQPATKVTLSDELPGEIFSQKVMTDDAANNFGNGTLSGVVQSGGLLKLAGDNNLGYYTRLTDATTLINWNKIAWIPQRPLHKELPDNGREESGYLEGNIDMRDNELLLHFNGNLVNTSGKNHYIYEWQWPSSLSPTDGKFNQAYYFSSSDNNFLFTDLTVDQSGPAAKEITMMAWVKPTGPTNRQQVVQLAYPIDTPYSCWSMLREGGMWRISTGDDIQSTGFSVEPDQWQHIAAVFDPGSGEIRFYKNGQAAPAIPIAFSGFTGHAFIGANIYYWGSEELFEGTIDEVAIFERALSSPEILDHYLRGVLDLKIQVRSCNDPNCDSEQFIGPDGTTDTFYSELSNKSTTTPEFDLNLAPNRYFQYRVELERDDNASPYSPELQKVMITHDDVNSIQVTAEPSEMICNTGSSTLICTQAELAENNSIITVEIRATANTPLPISNTVQVTSTAYDREGSGGFIDVSSTIATEINPVDLSITKYAPTSTVLAGDILPYTIVITNNSTDTIAAELVLTDTLPPGGDFDLIKPLPSGCTGESPEVICRFDDLDPVSSKTIILSIRPKSSGYFYNEVEVIAVNPPPTPKTASANPYVAAATNLQVNKSATSISVTAGKPLTYTITVNNLGPMPADTITLTDILTATIPYTAGPISPTGGYCSDPAGGNPITCSLGSLDVNKTITVALVIIPGEKGVITNTVSVTSELPDAFPGNNRAEKIVGGSGGVYLPIVIKNE